MATTTTATATLTSELILLDFPAIRATFWFVGKSFLLIEILLCCCKNKVFAAVLAYEGFILICYGTHLLCLAVVLTKGRTVWYIPKAGHCPASVKLSVPV